MMTHRDSRDRFRRPVCSWKARIRMVTEVRSCRALTGYSAVVRAVPVLSRALKRTGVIAWRPDVQMTTQPQGRTRSGWRWGARR